MNLLQQECDFFKTLCKQVWISQLTLRVKDIFISNRLVAPTVTFPAALLAIPGGMLSCSARGTPPIYTALIRTTKVQVNTTNTTTIRLYKDGNYTCHAINQYGTDMKELQVNFKSKRFSAGLISFFLSNIVQCYRVSPR